MGHFQSIFKYFQQTKHFQVLLRHLQSEGKEEEVPSWLELVNGDLDVPQPVKISNLPDFHFFMLHFMYLILNIFQLGVDAEKMKKSNN